MTIASTSQTQVGQQARLVTEIFRMMAGIEVRSTSDTWLPKEPLVWARVRFSGSWDGSMTMECTLPLAFAFTANFMSLRRPEEVNEDVSDVIGELTNTVAGNFKALLPSGCLMSIPAVGLYADGTKASRSAVALSAGTFETEHGAFCLLLEAGKSCVR